MAIRWMSKIVYKCVEPEVECLHLADFPSLDEFLRDFVGEFGSAEGVVASCVSQTAIRPVAEPVLRSAV